jgi:hypothetical protein
MAAVARDLGSRVHSQRGIAERIPEAVWLQTRQMLASLELGFPVAEAVSVYASRMRVWKRVVLSCFWLLGVLSACSQGSSPEAGPPAHAPSNFSECREVEKQDYPQLEAIAEEALSGVDHGPSTRTSFCKTSEVDPRAGVTITDVAAWKNRKVGSDYLAAHGWGSGDGSDLQSPDGASHAVGYRFTSANVTSTRVDFYLAD